MEFRQVGEGDAAESGRPGGSAAVEVTGDCGSWEVKGKHLRFACPHCERPMRMAVEQAGGLADCPHCGLEIHSPDLEVGEPARISDASRRWLGRLADFNPRQLRTGGMRAPQSRSGVAGEGGHVADAPGTGAKPVPGSNPFAPSADAGAAPRPTPVRMLDVEQLGAAFQSRDELEMPGGLTWEEGKGEPAQIPGVEEDPRDQHWKVFVLAGGFFVVLLFAMFMVLESRRGGDSATSGGAAPGAADEARYQRAFLVAQRALGAASWREMLPLVRARPRVDRVIADYYRTREFEPSEFTGFEDPVTVDASGTTYVQLHARTPQGERRRIGLEETADGEFLFDWESWADIARVEWQTFVEGRPSGVQTLRVTLTRCSPQERYFADAGLDRDGGRGVRIWLDGPGEPLFAILEKGDPAADVVWEGTSWELGRRVVAELSFPSGARERDRVTIHGIVQPRWLLP